MSRVTAKPNSLRMPRVPLLARPAVLLCDLPACHGLEPVSKLLGEGDSPILLRGLRKIGTVPAVSKPVRVKRRRGISLLEVLISMFVLLIGLLSVGAMIPAGRHEILAGVKLDYASMVGRAAFRDLKIREYTDPEDWRNSTPASVFNGTTFLPAIKNATTAAPLSALTPVVAIDPLGLASGFTATFPYNAGALSLTRIYPSAQIANATAATSLALADPIFRTFDDLILVPNTARDMPPAQQMFPFVSPVKRASEGNYSWLATIVSDPNMSALTTRVTISVAVFYKRDLSSPGAGETFVGAAFPPGATGIGGGEVTLTNPSPLVKPGQWIMLAGTAGTNSYFRWYRVLAADVLNATVTPNTQSVTLAGTDWNAVGIPSPKAWLFEGVIAVYEKNMRLELD